MENQGLNEVYVKIKTTNGLWEAELKWTGSGTVSLR